MTRATAKAATIQNPLALEEQVCFALAIASRSVIALYKPVLEPLGLTHPQYLVMLALWEHERASVKQLARLLQLEPATLSPLLKRLEAAGFVRRERDSHDERALSVVPTEKGRALRQEALKVPGAIVERLGMDLGELVELHERLTRVIAAAGDATEPGTRPRGG